jgi:hypothetical protein
MPITSVHPYPVGLLIIKKKKHLHNNETRSGHFMEDPTMYQNEKVAHRVEYRLSALISRVGRLFQLFRPINEEIEQFGLENPEQITDLTFKHRHRHTRRTLVERRETAVWARIRPEWIYPLRAKRFDPVTIMIAIVSALVAASVASIFTAVELDKMRVKQQKADAVAKLGLKATSEISNSQVELIRLTAEVTRSLDAAWGSIDTIDHERWFAMWRTNRSASWSQQCRRQWEVTCPWQPSRSLTTAEWH